MSVVDIGEAVFLVIVVSASIFGMVKVLFFDK
jgi:hypothetical protein